MRFSQEYCIANEAYSPRALELLTKINLSITIELLLVLLLIGVR